MSIYSALLSSLAAAALLLPSAHAAVIAAEFEFSGTINVGGDSSEVLGPEYPGNDRTGGVIRRSDAFAFSTVTASGFDDPVDGVTFANGVTAFGESAATSNNRVVVTITNDGRVAETLVWKGTIFGGGAGIVQPDETCYLQSLDTCNLYDSPSQSHDATAEIIFGAKLDGTSLFDGRIFVDDDEQVTSFDGIALDNLGLATDPDGNVVNSQYFWWDETNFQIDLGELQPGEMKTLEFFVMTTATASGVDGCGFFEGGPLVCIGAQAGFGDPDSNGGNQFLASRSYRSLSYSSSIEAFPLEADPIPLPAGIWLFGTVLASGLGFRRLGRGRGNNH
jgi:hypothetical protein